MLPSCQWIAVQMMKMEVISIKINDLGSYSSKLSAVFMLATAVPRMRRYLCNSFVI